MRNAEPEGGRHDVDNQPESSREHAEGEDAIRAMWKGQTQIQIQKRGGGPVGGEGMPQIFDPRGFASDERHPCPTPTACVNAPQTGTAFSVHLAQWWPRWRTGIGATWQRRAISAPPSCGLHFWAPPPNNCPHLAIRGRLSRAHWS